MKLTCQRQDLAGAVTIVERAVATKDTTEPLTGIHLSTDGHRLRLAATDLELAITCSIGADVLTPGETVLEARYFSQIVRRLPGDDVTLELLDDGQARLQSARVHYTVRTERGDKFPEVHAVEGAGLRVPENVLRTMIRQTVFAAATDDTRPMLMGVLLEAEGSEVRMVATDSNRLALRQAALAEPVEAEQRVIVPARALQELLRILGDGEDPVDITLADNRIAFEVRGVRLASRLVEGTFPNYRHVIPDQHDGSVQLPRTVFIDALERASLLAKRAPAVATLHAEDGLLTLQAREADVGQVREELDIQQEGASSLQNAYQVRLLLDALKAMEGDDVVMDINEGDRQATMRMVSNPDFLYIVMPVRL